MTRYIAFLRAINVGGRVVKMERLRQIFEGLGLFKVETFINSGNVIFQSSSKNEEGLRKKIEAELQRALGYDVPTFLRTDGELAEIAEYQAYRPSDLKTEGAAVFVAFLSEPPKAEAQEKLCAARNESDDFKFHGRELHWLCRGRFSDSKFSGARLEKMLGLATTVRNSTTVTKLALKYPPSRAKSAPNE